MNYHQATTLHRSPLRLSRAPQGKSVRQHVTDKPTVAIRYPIVEGLSQGSAGGGARWAEVAHRKLGPGIRAFAKMSFHRR